MTNMYGSAGNTADAPSDSLHLLGFPPDCQETTADNAENELLSTSLSNPEHHFSHFLCPPDIPNLDYSCFQDSSLPVTPLEPGGHHQNDASCPPGGPERVDGMLFFPEEDTVFKFPPPSSFAFSGFLPPQPSSMTSPGFEVTFMDTPPATPTDPDSLFDCQLLAYLTRQQPTQTPYGPQARLLNPPPHRPRLQGVSSIEDADFQDDLDVLEDINVFSDKELTTSKENEMSEAASLEPPLIPAGENLEPRLREAWERSQGSQSLAPLLKEELRLKIMKKRHDSGQEELKVDFTQSPSYQMTEEDEAKRNVRRAQNRGAAQRFRQRKKLKEMEMRKKLEENTKKKGRLRREVEILRREAARLQKLLLQHRHCGDCRLPPSTPPSFFSVDDGDNDEEEDF